MKKITITATKKEYQVDFKPQDWEIEEIVETVDALIMAYTHFEKQKTSYFKIGQQVYIKNPKKAILDGIAYLEKQNLSACLPYYAYKTFPLQLYKGMIINIDPYTYNETCYIIQDDENRVWIMLESGINAV